ncbi:MAG: hydantoinase/oxoprolinase family protein [Pseudomonadota bacterium]|nr:hydantoinase/oxoprolinase family protein [Pseudomonadota bacterium]
MSSLISKSIRAGVDIGGTFTDIVLEMPSGQISTKVLTTYARPEDAIIEGLLAVCHKADISPSDIGMVIHGTTLATNALIERRGAKTALITTQGFRDVIEMRTESRFEQYDLNLVLPEPLIPREYRYTVKERLLADGSIDTPLDIDDVIALTDELKAQSIQSIAVGLLHSYANPVHEQQIGAILAEYVPDMLVSLSSDVSPQMREYERFNTVAANAYVKPIMASYLERLKSRLKDNDISAPVFLMHSGGGIMDLESAAAFPVRLVESGPAGGAIFAADIASRFGLNRVVSFDMGGTTAKICLIKDQKPKTSRSFEVARSYRFKKGSGMPISIPVIDMVEIGAGGGSIASLDAMQQIRIGPESAGSEPGPASYQRGGTRPTVTDADLLMGKLDPDHFAGGSIQLSVTQAESTVTEHIATPLDLTRARAAFGMAEVVDENMANAARVHAVESGEDLASYAMIGFGGAGPLHAIRLAQKLHINRVLIPASAGVGSAVGFLKAPFSFEASQSLYIRLSDWRQDDIMSMLKALTIQARQFVETSVPDADIHITAKAYMRYVGQGWEIPVELDSDWCDSPDKDMIMRMFEDRYSLLFSRIVDGLDIEITSWTVLAFTPLDPARQAKSADKYHHETSTAKRVMADLVDGEPLDAAVFERHTLNHGSVIKGPAVITEAETTILIPRGGLAIQHEDGTIDIRLDGQLDDDTEGRR